MKEVMGCIMRRFSVKHVRKDIIAAAMRRSGSVFGLVLDGYDGCRIGTLMAWEGLGTFVHAAGVSLTRGVSEFILISKQFP